MSPDHSPRDRDDSARGVTLVDDAPSCSGHWRSRPVLISHRARILRAPRSPTLDRRHTRTTLALAARHAALTPAAGTLRSTRSRSPLVSSCAGRLALHGRSLTIEGVRVCRIRDRRPDSGVPRSLARSPAGECTAPVSHRARGPSMPGAAVALARRPLNGQLDTHRAEDVFLTACGRSRIENRVRLRSGCGHRVRRDHNLHLVLADRRYCRRELDRCRGRHTQCHCWLSLASRGELARGRPVTRAASYGVVA
jgi:hypothetical protein